VRVVVEADGEIRGRCQGGGRDVPDRRAARTRRVSSCAAVLPGGCDPFPAHSCPATGGASRRKR